MCTSFMKCIRVTYGSLWCHFFTLNIYFSSLIYRTFENGFFLLTVRDARFLTYTVNFLVFKKTKYYWFSCLARVNIIIFIFHMYGIFFVDFLLQWILTFSIQYVVLCCTCLGFYGNHLYCGWYVCYRSPYVSVNCNVNHVIIFQCILFYFCLI